MHRRALLSQVWCLSFILATKQEELCGSLNSRTTYIQLGEHDNIVLNNQTWPSNNILRCSTELITCPSCSIQIHIENLTLPQTCNDTFTSNNRTATEHCQCGGLSIWEPSSDSLPLQLCSTAAGSAVFTSLTRSVSISLDFVPTNWTGAFHIAFKAQKNQNIITGTIGQESYLTSPNFPSFYPRDFGTEHVLSCTEDDCIVTLLFTDFLISTTSIMEFYDWDGKPIHLVSGLISRPKPILSTGPMLTIRFFGNGGTALGYKAIYHFVGNTTELPNVNTECGGEVDNVGGTIYMHGLSEAYYDCVWIIQPSPSISHFKTHVYLKVSQFTEGELMLFQGQTSEDRLIETINEQQFNKMEHISPIAKGFYISFRGNVQSKSQLAISYSAFAYMDCLTGTDLLCMNKRCVSITLMCDYFDNCGDNSDEVDCKSEIVPQKEAEYWWPYRSSGVNSDAGPAGALLALGAALTGSAVLLAVTLCRVALRVRSPPTSHAPHHMDHIRTIAHLLNIGELDDREDEPPMYEPPPEYSQVVKPARPRRKHSTRRLINKETTLNTEEQIAEISETQILEKEQFVDLPFIQSSDVSDSGLVNFADATSQPISLETTGYNEDLGLSLTLSESSQKGIPQSTSYSQWLPPSKLAEESKTASNHSVLSFDTLYSSGQEFPSLPHPRHLIKSHSQDNILRLHGESSSSDNQSKFSNKPLQSANRISFDSIDFVQNCFSTDFPSTSRNQQDSDTFSQ